MQSTTSLWGRPGARRIIIVIAIASAAAAATAGAALRGHPSAQRTAPLAAAVRTGAAQPSSMQTPGEGRAGFDRSVPAAAEALHAAPGAAEESTATTF
ncbi:MAG: hypothetical protein M3Z29_00735 [Pseudomonadota bacterium]|nr:hypothetical protein [Pseudomonadota bacterium]